MKRFSLRAFVLFFACLAGVAICRADELAAVTGLVTDPNGRSVPGVTVLITNLGTNVTSRTVTNDQGIYRVPSLQPGIYRITLDKDGFKSIVKSGVELHVQDVASINFELQIGSVNETVTVEAGGLVINTTDAAVSTVVDRQFVGNLPLSGRTFQSLIGLTPGVVLASTPADDGQFSVNGQRADANYFMVDGVSANIGINPNVNAGQAISGATGGFSALGTTSNLVSIDAMQEFRVQTSTFAPEYGRTPGAQISIITRSGTNDFHGTAFEYLRNDALDANDWFTNSRGQKKAPLRQNDFGGVFGGPILKNRTFFFFSYEGFRLRLPKAILTQVPSLNARQIATPGAQPFLKAFPLPNGRDLTNNVSEFFASFSDPSSLNATSIRIDHSLNSRMTTFARYSRSPSSVSARGGAGGFNTANTVAFQEFKAQTFTGGLTIAIRPTINNDFRFNYSKNWSQDGASLDNFGGAVPISDSLLFPPSVDPKKSEFLFDILGMTAGIWARGSFSVQVQRQINIVDALSLEIGSHQVKLGGDYRRLFPISNFFQYAPVLVTNGVSGAISGTAFTGSVAATSGRPLFPVYNNVSLFGQDTWKTTQRLTLTYGLRWEVNPAPRERNGRDPLALVNVNDLPNLAFAPQGTPLYPTTYNNFAPRVGVAYQLFKKRGRETVVRGGFGVFYDLGSNRDASQLGNAFPNVALRVFSNAPLPLDPVTAAPPIVSLTPPFTSIVSAIDPNLKLPYTYQWNLAVERALGNAQTVTASYVSAIGRRLLRQEVLVNPNPNFTSIFFTRSDATSDYHALELEFQRRLSRGLQTLISYTWSHSIDDVSSDGFLGAPSSILSPERERGSSAFDVRHALNIAATYNVPRAGRGWLSKTLLQDWSVDSIFRTRSALPVNVVTGTDSLGLGGPGGAVARPDLILGVPLYISDPSLPGGRSINKAAFDSATPTAAKRQGTLGRNALRGFGMWQLDFGLRRQFSLTERLKLQFRAESFNIFNHPNFADPGMGMGFFGTNVLTNAQFGRSISMLSQGQGGQGLNLNPLYQVGGPRSFQLALKLTF